MEKAIWALVILYAPKTQQTDNALKYTSPVQCQHKIGQFFLGAQRLMVNEHTMIEFRPSSHARRWRSRSSSSALFRIRRAAVNSDCALSS